jgi:hypothetical protein
VLEWLVRMIWTDKCFISVILSVRRICSRLGWRNKIRLFLKCFTPDTVHPLVDSLIDVTILERLQEYLLHEVMMSLLRRTDEVGIAYPDTIPDSSMLLCHHICVGHDSHTDCLCGFDDFLRVLIDSSYELHFLT